MTQMGFSDAEYARERKSIRRERFLAEMEQVVSWAGLVTLFALSNLWMARRQLLADAGEVHL